jgi:hypothetical protein
MRIKSQDNNIQSIDKFCTTKKISKFETIHLVSTKQINPPKKSPFSPEPKVQTHNDNTYISEKKPFKHAQICLDKITERTKMVK